MSQSPNRDRGPSRGRRRTPRLEALEPRDLPTVLVGHHAPPLTPGVAADVQAESVPALVLTPQVGITNVPQGIPGTATAPPPNAAGGLTTAHALRRQTCVCRSKGGD